MVHVPYKGNGMAIVDLISGRLQVLVAAGVGVAPHIRAGKLRAIAVTVGVLLTAQVALGVSNILSGLNLAVAVGHNAGAALLLAALVVLNFVLSRGSRNRD